MALSRRRRFFIVDERDDFRSSHCPFISCINFMVLVDRSMIRQQPY